jgi:thiol:disulfide interchange protein DsbA
MNKRLVLPLLALLLAACSNPQAPADTTAATPAASEAAPTAEAPASAPAPATTAPAAGEPAAPDPASQAAAEQAMAAAANGPALVEGRDYALIRGGQPFDPLNGKVEVVEVFGYVCPACAAFQPLVNAWKAKLPADVRFTYVPAPFGPQWIPYAKAYYVAKGMGLVERTHDAVIKAIHVDNTLPGEGETPNEQAIADFYGQYGANPREFLSTMNSFTVNGQVNRGRQFMVRSGVNSTPTLVVNGKYRVMGNSFEDMLRIAGQLVAQERAATQGPAQPAATEPAAG